MSLVKQSSFRKIRQEYSSVEDSYNAFLQDYSNIEETGDVLTYWDMLMSANLLWENIKEIEENLSSLSSFAKIETKSIREDYKKFHDNVEAWKNSIEDTFEKGIRQLQLSDSFTDVEQRTLNELNLYHYIKS